MTNDDHWRDVRTIRVRVAWKKYWLGIVLRKPVPNDLYVTVHDKIIS